MTKNIGALGFAIVVILYTYYEATAHKVSDKDFFKVTNCAETICPSLGYMEDDKQSFIYVSVDKNTKVDSIKLNIDSKDYNFTRSSDNFMASENNMNIFRVKFESDQGILKEFNDAKSIQVNAMANGKFYSGILEK
ncbi:hypothetical protein ACNAUY_13505 [Acinetobacter tibetensis]|uniref:hypothetical protein n=1 Tax=Acinetobacter tibetensis TaxID=2943497 RepID=UPI003A4DD401